MITILHYDCGVEIWNAEKQINLDQYYQKDKYIEQFISI